MEKQEKKPLSQRYEVGLMVVSVIIVAALVAGISIFPEKGKEVAAAAMHMMTYTFGSTMQFITVIILIFLVALGFSKYGSIRLGKEKPDYKTSSWVAMMFFTGLGAGTVYWAFLEWGYHFNAAPQLEGAVVTEAYAYELSLAYAMFDWGPAAWALLCIFVLPFAGLAGTFFYNFFACLLRAVGNSVAPLWFLGAAALLNVGLDLLFVLVFRWGVAGAAAATVIAQTLSGAGLAAYTWRRCRELLPLPGEFRLEGAVFRELWGLSSLTCLQQCAMNFGILLIQRLVDSFGPVTMAAFAAGVKIDAFAYLPVQDFGNAFSTFVAQNYGAGQSERLRRGFRRAMALSLGFACLLSAAVAGFAEPLMGLFLQPEETAVLAAGVRYLRIEGAFYPGIACLFLLYGIYRAVRRPGMSVVLTVLSLGTRVALAYALAGPVGESGIWWAIPIGWFLADAVGLGYYFRHRRTLLPDRRSEE